MPNDKSLLTVHNLVFTGSTIGFVAPKAVATYQRQSVSLNTLDWVTGGSIPVLFHVLNQCREKKILPLSWYFDEHLPTLVCERLRTLRRKFGRRSGHRHRSADTGNHIILPIRNAQDQLQSTAADLEGADPSQRPEIHATNVESDTGHSRPSSDAGTSVAAEASQSQGATTEDTRIDIDGIDHQDLDATVEASSVDITSIPTCRRLTGLGPQAPSTTFHILTPEDFIRPGGPFLRASVMWKGSYRISVQIVSGTAQFAISMKGSEGSTCCEWHSFIEEPINRIRVDRNSTTYHVEHQSQFTAYFSMSRPFKKRIPISSNHHYEIPTKSTASRRDAQCYHSIAVSMLRTFTQIFVVKMRIWMRDVKWVEDGG
ncbi:hypothetical protein BD410DRAFT_809939 [Rickenella mellea]|uniref:Uncharacterized protein n=1 Tax=Rickenella mellea TaxID=50990 RepID=A0A4Y7PFM6_9AGAM|nr:hypothetical protein BD410DRAFT_809939 [Rickenella mellea]